MLYIAWSCGKSLVIIGVWVPKHFAIWKIWLVRSLDFASSAANSLNGGDDSFPPDNVNFSKRYGFKFFLVWANTKSKPKSLPSREEYCCPNIGGVQKSFIINSVGVTGV